jgi:hypothetical protein
MWWATEAEAPGLGPGIDTLAVAQEAEGVWCPGRGEMVARRRGHPARTTHRVHPHHTTRRRERPCAREAQERDHDSSDVGAWGGGTTHLER